jgi:hypothetical protein
MTVMIIDTLQFSKRMQNVGLNQKIAEELAEAIKDSTSISTDNLATKQDLQVVKNDVEIINKDIKSVEERLSLKIVSVEERLVSVEERLSLKIEMAKKDTIISVTKVMSVLITISTAIIGSIIALH